MWLSIAVGLLVCALLTVASFILARSSPSELNRKFAYFSLITGIWITANYIGANFKTHSFSHYFIHLDFFTGSFLVLSLWYFTAELLAQTSLSDKSLSRQRIISRFYLIVAVLAGSSTFLPDVIKITYAESVTSTVYGTAFIFYAAIMLILVLSSVINIVRSLIRSTGQLKRQVSVMLAGLIFGISFVAAANLIVPIITKSKQTNLITGNLAYIGILIFIASTFYSIIRHKLFDLRLILARAVAYALSITTFTAAYIGLTFLISSFLIKGYKTSVRQSVVTIALLLLLSVTINPVRRFFDKETNSLFYRDAYDPQVFLDTLNKAIIDNIELPILLRRTAAIIEENLKCQSVGYVIYDESSTAPRIIGTANFKTDPDLGGLHSILSTTKKQQTMSFYDDLSYDQAKIKSFYQKHNIAITASIHSPNKDANESNAYLVISNKRSGNTYSTADIRLIEIIANELVIAIQNARRFEEIQNFNVTLQQRINEATRKLRRANEKLKTLDETKDDFISMASHQLRTPLTSVKGYLSMVVEGDVGKISDTQRLMLTQAFNSCQRMIYIIADLLNVSRLKTGKFVITPTPVNLAQVINEEVAQLKEMASARSAKLIYEPPKNFPTLEIDETKTRQVIMNFLDNALYYTPNNGKIEVTLIDKEHAIEFRVKDNGLGVPKSEQPHLFTKFYRASNARKARPDGTGLGLYMAKKIIIAQGGAIIFDSHEGKGSTFGFILSKAHLKPAEAPIKPLAAVAK